MREIMPQIQKWVDQGKNLALATVIKTWGSAPRKAGAFMAVNSAGEFAGSVSGGCVEGAVIEKCLHVLETKTSELLHFGVADEAAWDVGLACGGEIDIFVQPLEEEFTNPIASALEANQPIYYSVIVEGPPDRLGSIQFLDEAPRGKIHGVHVTEDHDQKIKVFHHHIPPPSTIVIIGGVHIAEHLARFAKALEYDTVLIDPRKAFISQPRFSQIDTLIQEWPQKAFQRIELNQSTAIVTLTHDPKIDDPALAHALNSPAFYIGALGSKKTQEKRRKRLEEKGFTADQINRIFGPVGLDIGASAPAEIAVSILAQIIEKKNKLNG